MKLRFLLLASIIFGLLTVSPAKADPLTAYLAGDNMSASGEDFTYFIGASRTSPPVVAAGDTFTLDGIAPGALLQSCCGTGFTAAYTSPDTIVITSNVNQALPTTYPGSPEYFLASLFYVYRGTPLTLGTLNFNYSGQANILNGPISGPVPAASPVPEPSSFLLLGSGIVAAGGFLKRRFMPMAE